MRRSSSICAWHLRRRVRYVVYLSTCVETRARLCRKQTFRCSCRSDHCCWYCYVPRLARISVYSSVCLRIVGLPRAVTVSRLRLPHPFIPSYVHSFLRLVLPSSNRYALPAIIAYPYLILLLEWKKKTRNKRIRILAAATSRYQLLTAILLPLKRH